MHNLQEILESFKGHSELLLVSVTLLLCIATFALFYPTLRLHWHERRRRKEQQWESSFGLHCCKVQDFDPGKAVGNYRACGVMVYLPIQQDAEIRRALADGSHVLISGRAGIGKSHTAVHHLSEYRDWYLLRPSTAVVREHPALHLKRRKYVVLLDDLDKYLTDSEGENRVLDFIDHVESQSKQLRVVATLRSTKHEYDLMESISKMLGHWTYVELTDWTVEEGKRLSTLTKVDAESWDGTPLSAKAPSSQMIARYKGLSYNQQSILQALKLLKGVGIKPCQRSLLRRIVTSSIFDLPEADFERALSDVDDHRFLKDRSDTIEAYDPYLDGIAATISMGDSYNTVMTILRERRQAEELLAVGASWYERENFDEAERVYRDCITLFPETERCYYRLGNVLSRKTQWSDAIVQYRKAAELKPKWATPWYRLASALERLGKTDESLIAFGTARHCQEGSNAPSLDTIRLSLVAGKLQSALGDIETLTSLEPENAVAFYYKGRVLSGLGQDREAAAAFQKAVSIDTGMADAYFGMARPLRRMGDWAAAEEALRKTVELSPDRAEAYSFLAELLRESGRLDEASKIAAQSVKLRPDSPELHSYYGQVLAAQRRYPEMLEEYKRAIDLRPTYAEAHCGLAHALRGLKQTDLAIEANLRAVALGESSGAAQLGLGFCYADKRDFDRAEAAFREATRLNPNMAAGHFFLGKTLASLGRRDPALQALSVAETLGFNPTLVESARSQLLTSR